jgi:hypothetical protein
MSSKKRGRSDDSVWRCNGFECKSFTDIKDAKVCMRCYAVPPLQCISCGCPLKNDREPANTTIDISARISSIMPVRRVQIIEELSLDLYQKKYGHPLTEKKLNDVNRRSKDYPFGRDCYHFFFNAFTDPLNPERRKRRDATEWNLYVSYMDFPGCTRPVSYCPTCVRDKISVIRGVYNIQAYQGYKAPYYMNIWSHFPRLWPWLYRNKEDRQRLARWIYQCGLWPLAPFCHIVILFYLELIHDYTGLSRFTKRLLAYDDSLDFAQNTERASHDLSVGEFEDLD